MASPSSHSFGRHLGNVLAAGAILLALGLGLDLLFVAIGWQPFTACTIVPAMQILMGQTLSVMFLLVGFVVWAIGGFRNPVGLYLMLAGFLFAVGPDLVFYAIDPTCG